MENIPPELLQFGVTGVALLYLIDKGYKLFQFVLNKYNPQSKDGKQVDQQCIDIAVIKDNLLRIEGNELVHIKQQLDENIKEHREMFVVLERIETILKRS